MKASFRKKEEHSKRKNHHRAPSLADFVQLRTDAYVDAATPRNILALGHVKSARVARNISWYIVPLSASSTSTLLALPTFLTPLMHRKILRKTLLLRQLLPGSQRKPLLQHSGVAGLSMQRNGTILGRCASGAFVTVQDFLDNVKEKENGGAAKPARKRRARRVGEPLGRIDRPAAQRPTQPRPRAAPKPRDVKRRRVDDPAQQAPPGLNETQSSFDEWNGARYAFDLYVRYQSSCWCLWV